MYGIASSNAFTLFVTGLAMLTMLQAREYLERTNYSVQNAVAAFYADQDEFDNDDIDERRMSNTASASNAETPYTGPRTLDGRPAPAEYASGSSTSASKKPAKKKGLATLSSLGGGHDHDHDHDDDDDDFDEGKGPRDLFAGGEKSGLAVQDPSQGPSNAQKVIKDILAKAKSCVTFSLNFSQMLCSLC